MFLKICWLLFNNLYISIKLRLCKENYLAQKKNWIYQWQNQKDNKKNDKILKKYWKKIYQNKTFLILKAGLATIY